MSRCFPYPPPGFVRNPVAAAEPEAATTKLQKERGKAEKKKEKRSDRKALQQGESSKHSKHSHKKRKHEGISLNGPESKKSAKVPVEQLEKSGLSEEHGAPCFVQTIHGSPESSQDSSKRRKVVLPSPSQAKNGNILRIKIRRDQDSSASMLKKSKVEQSPVQRMTSCSSLVKLNPIQPNSSKVMEKSAAAQQQSIKTDSQAIPKQRTQSLPIQRVDPPTVPKVTQQIDAQFSMKAAMRRVGLPPAKMMSTAGPSAKAMGRVDPPPSKLTQRVDSQPAEVLQRVDPQLPSNFTQRDASTSSANVLQKETSTAVLRHPEVRQPPLPQNPKVDVGTPAIKQQQKTDVSLPNEQPCFSGRQTEAAPVPLVKQSKADRKKSRKAEKKESKIKEKESKIKDLFVTWNAPSFEMDEDLGDQDWLLGSARSDAIVGDCRDSVVSMSFQSTEQFSLQPRAIHLPDLQVYQLPYVIPF